MEKTLVVFFSAQGHTRAIARIIAQRLNADLFEIKPTQAYSDADLDWTNPDARCSREHENENLQKIALETTTIENWDEYGRVIILFPIWWGVAAWAAKSFVDAEKWGDKIVYPIAVSHSSPLSDSDRLLRSNADGGRWQNGTRFSQSASAQEIFDWCDAL